MKLAVYDEHEAVTTPNWQDLPIVLRPPPKPFPWKPLLWTWVVVVGLFILSVMIAVTASFLVDMTALGGGLYSAGVVLSSATLGAIVASVGWNVRRVR